MGLGLLIFDAYRPYHVTQLMWKKIGDPRYVADPSKGSGHNRGIAIDLTLIKLRDKEPLPMPTGFDNFSDIILSLPFIKPATVKLRIDF